MEKSTDNAKSIVTQLVQRTTKIIATNFDDIIFSNRIDSYTNSGKLNSQTKYSIGNAPYIEGKNNAE